MIYFKFNNNFESEIGGENDGICYIMFGKVGSKKAMDGEYGVNEKVTSSQMKPFWL
jgi:hypothetical protein